MPLDDGRPEAPYAQQRFTSYSLNFEDVILHRLFAGRRSGFYVDVGAGHPRFENDTYALYESGWSGLNIEPNETFCRTLEEQRSRDRNLCLALSDRAEDDLTFYEIPGTGLSTCDPEMAKAHEARGHEVQARSVRVSTLATVLEEADVAAVDILKVDVEGLEERVLAGNDWDRVRPAVILVEATFPERPERRPTGIRAFLEKRGYRHGYFDGLNDFYLREDFDERDSFALPPNVFDGFVLREIVDLHVLAESLESQFKTAQSYAFSLEAARKSETQEFAKREGRPGSARGDASSLETTLKADQSAHTARDDEHEQLRRDVLALEDWLVRILKGGPAELKRVTKDVLDRFFARTAGEDIMDLTLDNEAGHDEAPTRSERLVAAHLDGLNAENRRLERDLVDLRSENRRLRNATEQMRAEILTLHRALEPMHRLHEQVARLQARESSFLLAERGPVAPDPHRALNERDRLEAEIAAQRRRADHLSDYLDAIYTSSSWRLSAPVRVLGRLLRGKPARSPRS